MTIDNGLEIERTTKLTMEDTLSMVVWRSSHMMIAMEDSFSMEEERVGSTMAVARKRGGVFFFPSFRERERVINKLN